MQEILLIKNGELALKGLNRSTFESVLLKNLRHRHAFFDIGKRFLVFPLCNRLS